MAVSHVRDRSLDLKHLNPDDYHQIFEEQLTVQPHTPDYQGVGWSFYGFKVGDETQYGTITGFAREGRTITPFCRIGGRLYHTSGLKRL